MEFDEILEDRKKIRRLERQFRKNRGIEMSALQKKLLKILPSGLVPSNVGEYYSVAWPFTYTIDFDFGTNPTYGPATSQTQSFQNTQEAAFIFTQISRKSDDYSTSGELAPLQLTIKDRQSTRQFNDQPVPIQIIPKKSPYLTLEVPLIILPNAFIDFIVSSWLPANQATVGTSKHSFFLKGYRTRTEDIGTVLSTIYGDN